MTMTWTTTQTQAPITSAAAAHTEPDDHPQSTGPVAAPTEQQWRLLPTVGTRQLVVVIGFIAVLAYIGISLVAATLLVRTTVGHTLPIIVTVAGLGAGLLCGLAGLLLCGLRRLQSRHTSRAHTRGHASRTEQE